MVGYRSLNIYRVWILSLNKVISTRDVIFNEDELFDGNIQSLRDDLLQVDIENITELLWKTCLPDSDDVL